MDVPAGTNGPVRARDADRRKQPRPRELHERHACLPLEQTGEHVGVEVRVEEPLPVRMREVLREEIRDPVLRRVPLRIISEKQRSGQPGRHRQHVAYGELRQAFLRILRHVLGERVGKPVFQCHEPLIHRDSDRDGDEAFARGPGVQARLRGEPAPVFRDMSAPADLHIVQDDLFAFRGFDKFFYGHGIVLPKKV